MAKVSKELSKDLNRFPVGKFGGKGPRDLNNPNSNHVGNTHEDHGVNNTLGETPAKGKELDDDSV
jgi:hypothetical protein